jgi:pre-mRNA-splicing factor ATP-dependent RNA helicase DHX15/PRP43
MAHKRSIDEVEGDRGLKKQKTRDPKSNPYLAHMYSNSDDSDEDGGVSLTQSRKPIIKTSSNGYKASDLPSTGSIGKLRRHRTTAALAAEVEDGPMNPFTGKQLSEEYFRILKTRRNLPVHAQRFVLPSPLNY